ncbi:hypothetical protein B0A69_20440 [Chryseobacterium shigense]|uniref:Uncharacterized protein n=1 Tax=Chryseobacterium shigense TaxID=297244 RepID=A0A1N7I0L4_9FLAO|nr:hypothetical protein [Chryseobacterium shigense]PQA90697.1 hypothetical protein B0A69_20440 [Chryseobacterium shigense]SIS30635.1 hypothetical protein SAMN05421639_101980 [Chryseobacterium shigense]
MTSKKSLQKFTTFEQKKDFIFQLKEINKEDLEILNDDEKTEFYQLLTERFNKLKGDENAEFLNQIWNITPAITRNIIWESNQNTITSTISGLMQDYGRMPTASEIAIKSELSRQTVTKHLKEYAKQPQYNEIVEQFKFMTSKVLAKVFKFAVNGDMSAAKLYFNVVGALNQNNQNTFIQNNNNYIQINGLIFNDEKLKTLKPEQLKTIEAILLSEDLEIIEQKTT